MSKEISLMITGMGLGVILTLAIEFVLAWTQLGNFPN